MYDDQQMRRGVGLLLHPDSTGAVRVMGLANGSSAQRCGHIDLGDILLEVDGQDVYRLPLHEFGDQISGPEGTLVELLFQKHDNSSTTRVRLERSANIETDEDQNGGRDDAYRRDSWQDNSAYPEDGGRQTGGEESYARESYDRFGEQMRAPYGGEGVDGYPENQGNADDQGYQPMFESGMPGRQDGDNDGMYEQRDAPEPTEAALGQVRNALEPYVGNNNAAAPAGGNAGIGVSFCANETGCFVIAGLVPDGPADISGAVDPDDVLYEIDGVKVLYGIDNGGRPVTEADVAAMLRGPVDSIVDLKLQKAGVGRIVRLQLRRALPPRKRRGGKRSQRQPAQVEATGAELVNPDGVPEEIDGGDGYYHGDENFIVSSSSYHPQERRQPRRGGAPRRQAPVRAQYSPERRFVDRGGMTNKKGKKKKRRAPSPPPADLADTPDPLGLGIMFRVDSREQVRVQGVFPGSEAEACGQVDVGDTLYEVDKKNCWRKPLSTIERYLNRRSDGKTVTLGLRKKHSKDLVQVPLSLNKARNTGGLCGVGVIFRTDNQGAVHVAKIISGGAAEATGRVTIGDIVHEVDGRKVFKRPLSTWRHLVAGKEGTLVTLGLQSDGSRDLHFVQLLRKPLPEATERRREPNQGGFSGFGGNSASPNISPMKAGGEPKRTTVGIHFAPSITNGLVSVQSLTPGGPAERTGQVTVGDVLCEIDGKNVMRKPIKDWSHMITQGPVGRPVSLGLYKEGTSKKQMFIVPVERVPADSLPSAGAAPAQSQSPGGPAAVAPVPVGGAVAAAAAANVAGLPQGALPAPAPAAAATNAAGMPQLMPGNTVTAPLPGIPGVGVASAEAPSSRCGVGIELKRVEGRFEVSAVTPGGPAEKSGEVKKGNVLLAVDGKKTHTMRSNDIKEALLGEPGSRVVLTFSKMLISSRKVTLKRAFLPGQDQPAPAANGLANIPALPNFGTAMPDLTQPALPGAQPQAASASATNLATGLPEDPALAALNMQQQALLAQQQQLDMQSQQLAMGMQQQQQQQQQQLIQQQQQQQQQLIQQQLELQQQQLLQQQQQQAELQQQPPQPALGLQQPGLSIGQNTQVQQMELQGLGLPASVQPAQQSITPADAVQPSSLGLPQLSGGIDAQQQQMEQQMQQLQAQQQQQQMEQQMQQLQAQQQVQQMMSSQPLQQENNNFQNNLNYFQNMQQQPDPALLQQPNAMLMTAPPGGAGSAQLPQNSQQPMLNSALPDLSAQQQPAVDDEAILNLNDGSAAMASEIELAVSQQLPAIQNAIVFGSGRPFLSCLLTLKTIPGSDQLSPEGVQLAQACGSAAVTVAQARSDGNFRQGLLQGFAMANRAMGSQVKQVRRFAVLPRHLSAEYGELNGFLVLMKIRKTAEFANRHAVAATTHSVPYNCTEGPRRIPSFFV